MLDIDKLQKEFDEMLAKQTPETFQEWILKKRKKKKPAETAEWKIRGFVGYKA